MPPETIRVAAVICVLPEYQPAKIQPCLEGVGSVPIAVPTVTPVIAVQAVPPLESKVTEPF